ncbi:MAG: hypothetical protein AAFO69_07545 [Bacteroidota bacterium]
MINLLTTKVFQRPRLLFLIDGIGAILTALLLSFLVAPLESVFGLPYLTAYKLATVAIFMALYSMIVYKFFGKRWKGWMLIIAAANTLYCLATLAVVIVNWESITVLGVIYFVLEAAIIVRLVILEFRTAAFW